MYADMRGFFAGLAEERRAHPLKECFHSLAQPCADAPPSWFLEAAALWRATASLDPGNNFLFFQLQLSGWAWLTAFQAKRCKERLQQLCEGFEQPATAEEVVLENQESASGASGDFECMLQGQLDLVTEKCVWELKCSQSDLGESDRLQLAMYAYLYLCNAANAPRQFKLLNVLSGQVLELVLTTVAADGSRAWDPARCAAVRQMARVLLENALLPQEPRGGDKVVSFHAGDRARFFGNSAAAGGASGSGGASGGGGGGGVKRPRQGE